MLPAVNGSSSEIWREKFICMTDQLHCRKLFSFSVKHSQVFDTVGGSMLVSEANGVISCGILIFFNS